MEEHEKVTEVKLMVKNEAVVQTTNENDLEGIIRDNSRKTPTLPKPVGVAKQELLEEIRTALTEQNCDPCVGRNNLLVLVKVAEAAKQQGMNDVQRLANLSFGKVVVSDELGRLQQKNQQRRSKQMSILDEQRWFKIQNCPYQQIQKNKILQKTFIFRPYLNSKGFNVESTSYKYSKARTLKYIGHKAMLNRVNRLCFQRPTDTLKPRTLCSFQAVGKILGGVFVVALFILGILKQTVDSAGGLHRNILYATMALLGMYCLYVCWYSISVGLSKHDQQSQLQRLVSQVKTMFNSDMIEVQTNPDKPIKYQWSCPDDLLWVEVKLLGQFLECRRGDSKAIMI